jgi:hypothetical protein
MKKLVFLLTAVLVTAFSSSVLAQDGLTPYAGATHTYWVNTSDLTDASSDHLSSHDGNTYTWEVLRSGGAAADATDYSFETTSIGENINSVQIKWLAPAIEDGNPYFLVVTEVDGTGCSNVKAVQINPENAFAIVIQNVDETLADLGADKKWCAPDVTLNLADASIEYDYGTTTFYYRVDAQGLGTNWAFNYVFTETGKDANSTVTAFWGADVASATTALDYANGGSIGVPGGAQDIIIKVVIENGTSAEGETADHNIVLSLSDFSDGTNAPMSINGASLSSNNADITQTVKARPATSGIQTN